MKKTLLAAIGVASFAFQLACGGSNNDDPTKSGTGGSNNHECHEPAVSKTDGTTACEPECMANEHCSQTGVTCSNGCLTEANCPEGQTCDMSGGTNDAEGRPTGVCRPPTPCPEPTTGSQSGGGGSGTTGGGGGSPSGGGVF